MDIELTPEQRVKIGGSSDLYPIMREILLRENEVDQDREHLWVVCMNMANTILNIELVSMGSIRQTIADPMEVYSIPIQKRAAQIVLVHNHPSGNLKPSEGDSDMTDELIQAGKLMHTPVRDHLIISPEGFYSFADSGLLKELEDSLKYIPPYELKRIYSAVGEHTKAVKMAKIMLSKDYSILDIAELTGLKIREIENLQGKGEE